MNSYEEFLAQKAITHIPTGFDPGIDSISPKLYDFQRDIVRWSLRKGRSAIFAGCGLGKSAMQLQWAARVADQTDDQVLILAPLAVAEQTVDEGLKFDVQLSYCRHPSQIKHSITITNYEMMERFDPRQFSGIVLDESSVLKSLDGATRGRIIESFADTPYRLACSATPAPNEFLELAGHAEFLGIMRRAEMLATFFVHDGGSTQDWRLKGHAENDWWRWLCSWSVMVRSPSDIGYDGSAFELPPLDMIEHVVESSPESAMKMGSLFAIEAETLIDRRRARKSTLEDRVALAVELANSDDEQWLVWCDLNAEGDLATKQINGAQQIAGSDDLDDKIATMRSFIQGSTRVLVTKPSISGHGVNLQMCNRMIFIGLSDSWEQYYQAIRRCWRFGQKRPVQCHVVISDQEGAVLSNIKRKEADADKMIDGMLAQMSDISAEEIRGSARQSIEYNPSVPMGHPEWLPCDRRYPDVNVIDFEMSDKGFAIYRADCVEAIRGLSDDSIHFTCSSFPFDSLYTYSHSDRDMGNAKNRDDFANHLAFLIPELFRVTKPGRIVAFHCMNLPTSKARDGIIGIRDFRGELIRAFADAGWIYHSEVCIWKDPVTAMQRTKALGLLHKQLKKDSCMSRQGIPDYLVAMRKPGDNADPVSHTNETFPVKVWQRYASPVWFDINPSDTLQFRSAREDKDERHVCPLQLQVIERAIELWTNPDDIVLDPFAGIGSTGYVALQQGRKFVGIELKESYYKQAAANLQSAERAKSQPTLFSESLDASVTA